MPRRTKRPATPPAIDSVSPTIRGERVILDADLAKIYSVATKVFNQAVKRNREKFESELTARLDTHETALVDGCSASWPGWSRRHPRPKRPRRKGGFMRPANALEHSRTDASRCRDRENA
jgi:hypothetical protein